MPDKDKKLEISSQELDLIASALETQSKILRMQAHAGGKGALARLNEVKRVLATITSQRESETSAPKPQAGLWGAIRSLGQAV